MTILEQQIENALIEKLGELKYRYRPDIRDRTGLEANFFKHFEELNAVRLTPGEKARLLDEIVSPDVFLSAQRLRERQTIEREDGTKLHFTLVNIKDWCKNNFEVINQLRINSVLTAGLFLGFAGDGSAKPNSLILLAIGLEGPRYRAGGWTSIGAPWRSHGLSCQQSPFRYQTYLPLASSRG